MGKHQFLLYMYCQASFRALLSAALVDADQDEFIVSSTIIDSISPAAEVVRTSFFDTSTDVSKIDNPCPAQFECISGWDVAFELQVAVPLGSTEVSPSLRACWTSRCMVSRLISL